MGESRLSHKDNTKKVKTRGEGGRRANLSLKLDEIRWPGWRAASTNK